MTTQVSSKNYPQGNHHPAGHQKTTRDPQPPGPGALTQADIFLASHKVRAATPFSQPGGIEAQAPAGSRPDWAT